jgi:hypothetical protein
MTQDTKNFINNYLTDHFSIKRVKNNFGKWKRVIKVDGGLVRKPTKNYQIGNGINIVLVTADLIQVLINMFGCTQKEAEDLVYPHVNKFKTSIKLHRSSAKPTRKVKS